jgi:anti-sigma factor RsiW
MPEYLNIEEKIQDYIDGFCDENEAAEIERNIAVNAAWKATYASLSEINRVLQSDFEPMEPSMRFSKNVMEQIAGLKIAKPTRQYLNPVVIWLIGGILVTMLVFIIGYAVSLADWSATGGTTTLKIPEVQMPAVNWGSYINNNTTMLFLLLNTVLGFALFDKWLRRKKASV